MAIPVEGTFCYVVNVPDSQQSFPWPVHTRTNESEPQPSRRRLVGFSPQLEITDAGPMPNPSATRPAVMRTRFTLNAGTREDAQASSISFCVARDVMLAFKPDDALHMVRTHSGGLGLALIRDEQLKFAVGAVSAVPLGKNVSVQPDYRLHEDTLALYRTRDPSFEPWHFELPLDVTVDGQRRIVTEHIRELQVGDYSIWVEHGIKAWGFGDECLGIAWHGAIGRIPVIDSAKLLEIDGLEILDWEGVSAHSRR